MVPQLDEMKGPYAQPLTPFTSKGLVREAKPISIMGIGDLLWKLDLFQIWPHVGEVKIWR